MIEGHCHCGALRWSHDGTPKDATACNCSICRRYGTLWAYGHQDEDIRVQGPTRAYLWGERSLGFHFCPTCGCVGYWRAESALPDGRRRIAVNLRLAAPEAVRAVPLRLFDGHGSFDDLPRDGRCLAAFWL
ncbi:GFA family protein [uncultured Limimaricola sp.]|uniref:GFA family protein n=1 Tax=uncultured Limimaricola sp. TaxID=2211667 RepID=UPI0030F6B240